MEVLPAVVAVFSVGAREISEGLLFSEAVLSGCVSSGDKQWGVGEKAAGMAGAE